MYQIDKDGNISVVRGDSASFHIDLVDADGNEYNLVEGDTLTFTVKKSSFSKSPLIQKHVLGNIIDIHPQDTIELPYGGICLRCATCYSKWFRGYCSDTPKV